MRVSSTQARLAISLPQSLQTRAQEYTLKLVKCRHWRPHALRRHWNFHFPFN